MLGLWLALGGVAGVGCRIPLGNGKDPGSRARPAEAGAPLGQAPDHQELAIIGARVITAGDLRARILERYYGPSALQGLIKEELFLRDAERLGVAITEAELQERVDAEIDGMLAQLGNDRAQLAAALAEEGTTLAEHQRTLRQEFRNLLLVERVVLAHRRQQGVTDKAIRDHYARTYSETRLRVRHIAFPIEPAGGAELAASAALERCRQRADDARLELVGGADFGRVARQRSGDPVTVERGGMLGWIDASSLRDEQLTQAIFALPVGVVSQPILQDGYGYHLFLVEERREAQPLEAVRHRLEAELLASPPGQVEIRAVERALRAQTPVTVLIEDSAAKGGRP